MNKLNFIGLLVLLTINSSFSNENPRVKIYSGELEGTVETARNGRSFYRFMGIPYGKVEKRFGISRLADGWKGVKDATKPGTICLQIDDATNTIRGSEDCLILNIYTPKISTSGELLPVMVFIHGGAYFGGSANEHDGSYFMSEDVVQVAINYRLGPLGFLNAEIEGASGNQGLKDQVLALQWVQKNIQNFGGNPDQVVIFGESAGGASVSQLTMSPMAKGLFKGAISQSGSFYCPFANTRISPLDQTKQLARLVDCPSSNTQYMVECLQRIKGEELVRPTVYDPPLHFALLDTENIPQFVPTIETVIPSGVDSEKVFCNEDPLKILLEGRFNKVPWITGVVSHEGIWLQSSPFLNNDTLLDRMNNEWGRFGTQTLNVNSVARDPYKLVSEIREFYFNNEEINMANKDALTNLYSDRWFVQGIRQAALLYSRFAPVYLYNFTYRGEFTFDLAGLNTGSDGRSDPTHVDDLIYLTPIRFEGLSINLAEGSDDWNFSENLVKSWVSFAKNLKPSTWGSLKEWPEVEFNNELEWVHLDKDVTIQPESKEFRRRMDFWDKILLPIQMKSLNRETSAKSLDESTCSKPVDSLVGTC